MSAEQKEPLHPDDVPSIIELRGDLSDAFRAVVRRYELRGFDEEESRQEASDFVRGALKKVTLDIEPSPEEASFKEILDYVMRQKPKVVWSLVTVPAGLVIAIFSLGMFIGSHMNSP